MYLLFIFFFFNDTATTEIYTLSLHDALPIFTSINVRRSEQIDCTVLLVVEEYDPNTNAFKGVLQVQSSRPVFKDRKSTRLNSSHVRISYAVFCLKKKIKK